MLNINMEDVYAVVGLLTPHFIALGVIVAVALAIAIGVRKMAKPQRFLARGMSLIAMVVGIAIVVNLIAFGPMSTLLGLVTGSGTLSEETTAEAEGIAEQVAAEGIVLLENSDDLLPLVDQKNINLFGWASANSVFGGSGSGGLNNLYPLTTLQEGLTNAGFSVNEELTAFYTGYSANRPEMSIERQSWTLPEPPVSEYTDELLTNAKEFSDVAVVVIGRMAGEGHTDMPINVSAVAYDDNSADYADFEAGEHYLQLSETEAQMIELVTQAFENVVVVLNSANPIEMGFVDEYPQIKSVVWSAGPGNVGFKALGKILSGEVNPSGHSADTFIYQMEDAPWWNNQVKRNYENMMHLETEGMNAGRPETFAPSFINYADGIYVGYKYYETAAAEGVFEYDDVVQYPFGHGLSYSSFEQEMSAITETAGVVSFDVTVTNTGKVAGKDVVQVYSNPPYTNGGVEKSSANLVAFAKTQLLEPGASETLTIEFGVDDLASYDMSGNGQYVLEAGDYVLSINADSHTVLDDETYTVAQKIEYDADNPRPGELVAAENLFDDAAGDVTYLSRADGFANHDEALAAPDSLILDEPWASEYHVNANFDPNTYLDPSAPMPTTGASNGLTLDDLRGADYDDPRWEDLLDQATVPEMAHMIALAGYQTAAMPSIGKNSTVDSDGPAAINNNFTGQGSLGFPVAVVIASTWNAELVEEYGQIMGKMSRELGSAGWYAPAINLHRIAFGARNYEYFSEDSVLSGAMSAAAVTGARSEGVYSYIKHFALYDFNGKLTSVWANEQSIRETYLKPFEISVKDGGANAVMVSWNYLGSKWVGEWSELNQDVLRGEWGFQGMVLTDFFRNNGHGFMTADMALANGVDAMLSTFDGGPNNVTDPNAPSTVQYMRDATKNVSFTVASSWVHDETYIAASAPAWKTAALWINVALGAVLVGAAVLIWRRSQKLAAGGEK